MMFVQSRVWEVSFEDKQQQTMTPMMALSSISKRNGQGYLSVHSQSIGSTFRFRLPSMVWTVDKRLILLLLTWQQYCST